MAKTYNSIPTVSTGDVYTATAHNNIVTNVNNYRVAPICILKKSISVTSAVVTWDFPLAGDEEVDTDDMHSIVTNTSRITPSTAGLYLVTASVAQGIATNSTSITIWLNGADFATQSNDNATVNSAPSVSTVVNMNGTTDYLQVRMYASTTQTYSCRFCVAWLGQVS